MDMQYSNKYLQESKCSASNSSIFYTIAIPLRFSTIKNIIL